MHNLCSYLIFFVQKLFLTKNYFFTAEITLTPRVPLYTCFVTNKDRQFFVCNLNLIGVDPGCWSCLVNLFVNLLFIRFYSFIRYHYVSLKEPLPFIRFISFGPLAYLMGSYVITLSPNFNICRAICWAIRLWKCWEVDSLNFHYFQRFCNFSFKNTDFWPKMAKSWKKIKNLLPTFLGPMVLHIWSKFHVSSLIFEGEDLFLSYLRKTYFCEKWAFLIIFGSNFQNLNISTHETYWNM